MKSQIAFCQVLRRRRQWHPTPVLLPGESHGRRSLVGCSPWGREESDTTERLHFPFSLSCIGEGNGNPLQCSCLENPRDGGAWWAAVSGVAQSRTRLKRLSSSSSSSKVSGQGRNNFSLYLVDGDLSWVRFTRRRAWDGDSCLHNKRCISGREWWIWSHLESSLSLILQGSSWVRIVPHNYSPWRKSWGFLPHVSDLVISCLSLPFGIGITSHILLCEVAAVGQRQFSEEGSSCDLRSIIRNIKNINMLIRTRKVNVKITWVPMTQMNKCWYPVIFDSNLLLKK